MNGQLMFCGHRGEGQTNDGKPVCELCLDFTKKAEKPVVTFQDHIWLAASKLNTLSYDLARNSDISAIERHYHTAEQLSAVMSTLEAAWEILNR
jgi:hypothetical protein